MHESSVMDGLMKNILQLANERGGKKVTKVSIKLGAFSQMSPSHFKDHFLIAARGTLAEGAEIDAEEGEEFDDPSALGIVLKSIDVAD